ncbi:MAG: oligosaccharide flippase family protein [Desulfobacterales bacterium]|nr:oligosaccharide flippase family protein [Desulfobacterales bacterium]
MLYRYCRLSQLKKNVLSGPVLAVGSIPVLLISYPLYLYYLGTKLYGLWATISVVVAFSQLGNMGINTAIVKYTAEEYGKRQTEAITEYFTTSVCILAVASALIIAILVVFRYQIVAFLDLDKEYQQRALVLVPWVGGLSVIAFLANLARGTLTGIGRADLSNYVFLGGRLMQVAVSLLFLAIGLGIWGLFLGALFSHLIVLSGYIGILTRYKIRLFSCSAFRRDKFRALMQFGGTLWTAQTISMLTEPFNKVVISKYVGLSEVTFYDIAVKAVVQLRGIYAVGLAALVPKISEIRGRFSDFKDRIADVHDKGVRFAGLAGFPLFFGLFMFCRPMMKTWLGANYDEQIVFGFRILLLSYYLNLLAVPSLNVFLGLGRMRVCFNSIAMRSFLNFSVVFLFILLNSTITLNLMFVIHSTCVVVVSVYVSVNYVRRTWLEDHR